VRRLTKSGFESEALVRTIIGTVQPGSWHRAVTSVEVSADGRTVTFKNDTETIQLWDAQTGKPRSQPTKREAAIEPLPGWLVVRQTQETHGEIYGLLQTLQQLADTEP
jgi:WD40 repeat protein